MGESSNNHIGFNSRAAALLNNQMFSDVEIQVKDGNNHKTFHAHKLFLSMSSREFASMFYGKFEPPKFIKIFDFKPHTVFLMLQYLYSDDCDVSTIEEAKYLYSLAKKFRVTDLEKYCLAYLSKEEITFDNLFDKYEFALSEGITSALENCRDLVSKEATALLNSSHFAAAPLSVVEDILQLDTLNVKSELDVIVATVEWARQECLRRGSYTENLRICLYPLFKYLRFLSLTAIEFCDFVEKNENILNSHESTMLTMSLIKPSSDYRLPSGFSSNSSPRVLTSASKNQLKNSHSNAVTFNLNNNLNNVLLAKETPLESILKSHLSHSLNKTEPMSKYAEPSSEKELLIKSTRGFYSGYISASEQEREDSFAGLVKEAQGATSVQEKKYSPSGFKPTKEALIAKDVEYVNLSNRSAGSEQSNKYGLFQYKRSESVPSKKQYPTMKVSPQITMNQRRTFEFPLKELGKSVSSAFPSDIKCSATIYLHRGAIQIYGIELMIQEKENENDIKAFLSVVGSDRLLDVSYDGRVKNGMFPMEFSEPLMLVENSHIKIEVLVEDLVLNRCYGYFIDRCEFNCGLNLKAEISMKSNQFGEERGYFFLISRLLYKAC